MNTYQSLTVNLNRGILVMFVSSAKIYVWNSGDWRFFQCWIMLAHMCQGSVLVLLANFSAQFGYKCSVRRKISDCFFFGSRYYVLTISHLYIFFSTLSTLMHCKFYAHSHKSTLDGKKKSIKFPVECFWWILKRNFVWFAFTKTNAVRMLWKANAHKFFAAFQQSKVNACTRMKCLDLKFWI